MESLSTQVSAIILQVFPKTHYSSFPCAVLPITLKCSHEKIKNRASRLLLWLILVPWGYASQVDLKFSMSMISMALPSPINPPGPTRPWGVLPIWREPWTGLGENHRLIAGRRGYDPRERLGQSGSGPIHHRGDECHAIRRHGGG